MSAWTSIQSGNWTRTSDNADSPWYDGGAQTALSSYPGESGDGDTVTIGDGVTGSQNVVLDGNPTYSIASITNGDNTSYITVSTTRTLTLTGDPAINSSYTSYDGFIRVTGDLTITHDQGAGTVCVLHDATAGNAIKDSGSASWSISNAGGTALKLANKGRVLYHTSSGTLSITGDLHGDSSEGASSELIRTAAGTVTITGDLINDGSCDCCENYGGTINLIGTCKGTGGGAHMSCASASGTYTWTGNRSIAASDNCHCVLNLGTMNFATAGANLVLANSGSFVLEQNGGTLNVADAGSGAAEINNQDATSYAAMVGPTDAQKAIISQPAASGGGTPVFGGMVQRRA